MRRHLLFLALLPLAFASSAQAETLEIPMTLATPAGPGEAIGVVRFSDGPAGVIITLELTGVAPGPHGLHIHQNPSCAPATAADGTVTPAGAAGPHLDPGGAGRHLGPEGAGHLGDLPRVEADHAGRVSGSFTAPRIASVAALRGHAVMLHVGGDNYADTPKPLGGGGARLACGVIPPL